MKLSDIINFLEDLAPVEFQEGYDNSGLILGNSRKDVSNVLVCLDISNEALDFAIQNQCQLVLSHHPIIFKAVKKLTWDTPLGRLLIKAIKHDIAFYSFHTNYDSVIGGLSDVLCKRIGMTNIKILKKGFSLKDDYGLGRYGEINPVKGEEFLSKIKSALSLNFIRIVGEIPDEISVIAVYNGAYDREILDQLVSLRPDAFLTGDLKYHDAMELKERGIFTIDAGHFGTEKIFVQEIAQLLQQKFSNISIYQYEGSDVFSYYDSTQ